MIFTQHHRLDIVNKLVIFEASGDTDHVDKMGIVIQKAVALAIEHKLKGVLLDLTELGMNYDPVPLVEAFEKVKKENWLASIKIARLIAPGEYTNEFINHICHELELPIRTYESKSKAISWLLYNFEGLSPAANGE
ncbi:hypothetical protein P4S73_26165 [Paraglaciecola sp. Hal342]|jgi:hypothetical protein